MKKQEAIKYLQQLYHNDGHCWLDEQRIEAIGMAIKALQEEPVSEELEVAADNCYFRNHGYARESFKEGANWQKEQDAKLVKRAYFDGMDRMKELMMKEAVEIECGWLKPIIYAQTDKIFDYGNDDRVKLIIVKEE